MSKLKTCIDEKLPAKSVLELSTDELAIFNLLVLITDIEYRARYGKQLEQTNGKGYSVDMRQDP